MNTLFLHIGIHKTGTTALQEFFWSNCDQLAALGWCYPQVGLSGVTHAGFVNAARFPEREAAICRLRPDFDLQNSPYRLPPGTTSKNLYEELALAVNESDASSFLMSSECFFEWTNPACYAEGFSSIFDTVHVMVYLREPVSWLDAVYEQLIRDPWFKYAGQVSSLPQWTLLDYASILEKWAQAFGQESIHVSVYDAVARLDIVRHLLSLLNLPADANWNWPQQRVNAGLRPDLARLLKASNQEDIDPELRAKLVYCLSELTLENPASQSDLLLKNEEIVSIKSMVAQSNQKLASTYSIKFDSRYTKVFE